MYLCNLVKIHPLVQKITHGNEATRTGSTQKPICPPPFGGEDSKSRSNVKVIIIFWYFIFLTTRYTQIKYQLVQQDSGGSRGGSWGLLYSPPPPPQFLNILWKWNNLVPVRPNYFIFIGYLGRMFKRTPQLNIYELPFQKSWIRPCKNNGQKFSHISP